jgi:two-component system sensor histidine kinase KdpD
LVRDAERAASEIFGGEAAIFVPDEQGMIRAVVDHPASFARDATETAVAQWVVEKGHPAGCGTDTLTGAQALYQPLRVGERTYGVLGIRHPEPETLLLPDQRQLLTTFAQQLAQALDRCRLIDVSLEAEMEIERERLRSSLLSGVSHDLRTPLAVITGAAESLLDPCRSTDETLRRELLETIRDEGQRLNRLVENLLHMTRLESGQAVVEKELHVPADVIGSALHRVRPYLGERPVTVTLGDDLPLVPMDAILIEQVLINLLENSAKYSASTAPIGVAARREGDRIRIEVDDRGRGLGPGEESRVFEKFFRGVLTKPGDRGAGLGLAICRAIVTAHGGEIRAANRPDGGARFWFTLPGSTVEASGDSHSASISAADVG